MQADRNQKALHELAAKPGNSECCIQCYGVAMFPEVPIVLGLVRNFVAISLYKLAVIMALKVVRKTRTYSTTSTVTETYL